MTQSTVREGEGIRELGPGEERPVPTPTSPRSLRVRFSSLTSFFVEKKYKGREQPGLLKQTELFNWLENLNNKIVDRKHTSSP